MLAPDTNGPPSPQDWVTLLALVGREPADKEEPSCAHAGARDECHARVGRYSLTPQQLRADVRQQLCNALRSDNTCLGITSRWCPEWQQRPLVSVRTD